MTLFEIIRTINEVAASEPNINTLVLSGNVFDLNTNNITVRYSTFCCEQMTHQHTEEDFLSYGFRFYFVDRLTEDSRNKIEVQSKGIQTLESIIHKLRDLDIFDIYYDYYYTPFTNRFEAWCAGVFCELRIQVPADYCYDDIKDLLGDFNIDFNLDFWVKPIVNA